MNITAEITGIEYTPFFHKCLNSYDISLLEHALSSNGTFILNIDTTNKVALSWWVSAKRTRSYPYARVYDSLYFIGKKITIIPIFKDEGQDGDRDFLQWDTISLMSLLGVYAIIGYYSTAVKNISYRNKITNQRYDINYIKEQIKNLLSYQSDALHWNLSQIDKCNQVGELALKSYENISISTGVQMHPVSSAQSRIRNIMSSKESFMASSRMSAKSAQYRESQITHLKENVNGTKGTITITNYVGGKYHFTVDEIEIIDDTIYLIEAKNTKSDLIPSISDIKDGLLKMILFSNLENVQVDGKVYKSIPVLKLTSGKCLTMNELSGNNKQIIEKLKQESFKNGFKITYNGKYIH
jgi:hypothetical protein